MLTLASPFKAGNASAVNITFNLADFMISTATTSGVNLFAATPSSAPALPERHCAFLPPRPWSLSPAPISRPLFRCAVPATLQHVDAVATRVLHALRRRVGAHRLTVQQVQANDAGP